MVLIALLSVALLRAVLKFGKGPESTEITLVARRRGKAADQNKTGECVDAYYLRELL